MAKDSQQSYKIVREKLDSITKGDIRLELFHGDYLLDHIWELDYSEIIDIEKDYILFSEDNGIIYVYIKSEKSFRVIEYNKSTHEIYHKVFIENHRAIEIKIEKIRELLYSNAKLIFTNDAIEIKKNKDTKGYEEFINKL
ncbi:MULTISPECIES: hypothetical protein [Mammaliicoccus]|uniref:hypothetical protein n=1 Tax=Mammaliicoccus TaxID=2803850 RepID=UPI002B257284|nr:hypothetical protein [Mammaliicoccus sciuri]WQK63322.1 hypothetical protein P3U20_14220 [Mammaliicoccus sciuri]